jgi:hypothetical protein
MSYQYPPQQPWELPPEPSLSSQSTQPQPVPSVPITGGKPPKKPATKKETMIGLGCFAITALLLISLCGVIGNVMNVNHGSTSGAPPSPTATQQAAILVATATTVLPTDTPTATDTPQPTATPTVRPTPKPQPTQPPRPTPTPAPHCSGVNGNPWCYDFNPGKLIYVPPSGFCGYFNCIASFYGSDDPGDGYIIECQDSTYSQSGGERGACSSHGGELRPLYSH